MKARVADLLCMVAMVGTTGGCASLPNAAELGPCVGIELSARTFRDASEAMAQFQGHSRAQVWLLSPEYTDGIEIRRFDAHAAREEHSTSHVPTLRRFVPIRLNNLFSASLSWERVSRATDKPSVTATPPGTYRVIVRYLAEQQGHRVLCTATSPSFQLREIGEWLQLR